MGSAVRFRHCPATVKRAPRQAFCERGEDGPENSLIAFVCNWEELSSYDDRL